MAAAFLLVYMKKYRAFILLDNTPLQYQLTTYLDYI